MNKKNPTIKLGGETYENAWVLIYDIDGIKVIQNASQFRFYKQLQVNEFEILTFLLNTAMSNSDSFSYFSFQGELNQSEKLNKFIILNNETTYLYNLFKRQNVEVQQKFFLECQLNSFKPIFEMIDILQKTCKAINKIDYLLTIYKNLIAKIKIDQNNKLFNQLIDEFIKKIQEID